MKPSEVTVEHDCDIKDELVRAVRECIRYLSHPEVQAIPFATSAEFLVSRLNTTLAKAGEAQ